VRRGSRAPFPKERPADARSLGRRDDGAVSAELVIATPLLLLLILGVIQFALWQHAEHVASAVAQQGLSVARLQDETAGAGKSEAQSVLEQLGPRLLSQPSITATRTNETTTVTVSGRAESILGVFSLPVTATASGPTEQYTDAGGAP
jgi:Flp pilus assembly protein TadG